MYILEKGMTDNDLTLHVKKTENKQQRKLKESTGV